MPKFTLKLKIKEKNKIQKLKIKEKTKYRENLVPWSYLLKIRDRERFNC